MENPSSLLTNHCTRLISRDVDCPQKWQKAIKMIIPKHLHRLGPRDMARYLPERHQSRVTMVNVGTYGSLYNKPLSMQLFGNANYV